MGRPAKELGWDSAVAGPVEPLASLPYARIESAEGVFLTSSRLEPHRLAAAYVRDARFDGQSGGELVTDRLGLEPGRPLDWRRIYRAIFELDPLCLIHGVFFSSKEWHGNPKVRRSISAVIEARDAAAVISGGLKRDDVSFTKGEAQGAEEGYGFVPFGRTEYTAREIVLSVVVDLGQIRGYGLGEPETSLLIDLALWEVASLLESPLRLRTACDLEMTSAHVRRPEGFELPTAATMRGELTSLAVAFAEAGARRGVWTPRKSKAGTKG